MSENSSSPRHRDDVADYPDIAFQVLAAQISANYLKFLKTRVNPELGAFSKMSMRELRTLMTIAHFALPITGARISRILSYDPATVTRSVRGLTEKGLIVAADSLNDARSVLYDLTPKGLELSERYRALSKQAIAELNAEDPKGPSRKEIQKALSVLEAVRDRSQQAVRLGEAHKRGRPKA